MPWRCDYQPLLKTDPGGQFGGQGRCGNGFPTGAPQVYDFDLVGVKLGTHGGGDWCQIPDDQTELYLGLQVESQKTQVIASCKVTGKMDS